MSRYVTNCRIAGVIFMMMCSHAASANSISFDAGLFVINENGQIEINVYYDFTDFAMFGGGMNLIYDASAIEFVSYTQADYSASDVQQNAASPIGMLDSPGRYLGFGIGTFEFFNGISSAGAVGTFVFNYLGSSSGIAECNGFSMCLTPDPVNPLISLSGEDVTNQLLPVFAVSPVPIPAPAAVWLLLSGFCVLAGIGRKATS